MTKPDLIEAVSRAVNVTRKDAEGVVENILSSIVRSLRTGDKVEIRGFGSFRVRERKARTGRNPKTGAAVFVPAKKVSYYTPSRELKDAVNATASDQE